MPDIETSRIVDTHIEKDEVAAENAIRPRTLDEFIGQTKVREQMDTFITAAKQRKEALDHVLCFAQ